MSGIVGSRLNIRGSGLVGSIGTDGQALTSSGAGAGMVFEDAGGFDVSSITGATALAEEPATTDELVISDGGSLKRLDFTHIQSHPACLVGGWGTTSLYPAHGSATLIDWAVERYDIGGCYNHTGSETTLNSLTAPAYSFVPNVPGVYQVCVNCYLAGEGVDGDSYCSVQLHVNGSDFYKFNIGQMEHGHFDDNNIQMPGYIVNLPLNGTGDYVQTYMYNNSGEAPELNFGYSSLSYTKVVGLTATTRP